MTEGYYEQVDPDTGILYRYWWRIPDPNEFVSNEPLPDSWTNVGFTKDGL